MACSCRKLCPYIDMEMEWRRRSCQQSLTLFSQVAKESSSTLKSLFYSLAGCYAFFGTVCLRALRAIRVTNMVTTIVATIPSQKDTGIHLPASAFFGCNGYYVSVLNSFDCTTLRVAINNDYFITTLKTLTTYMFYEWICFCSASFRTGIIIEKRYWFDSCCLLIWSVVRPPLLILNPPFAKSGPNRI